MKIALQACSGRHPAAHDGAPDALRALSLEVAAGEQVAVIGPSGAGKTTLLHLLACALAPSGGALALDGRDPWTLPRARVAPLARPTVPGAAGAAAAAAPARGHGRAGRAIAAHRPVAEPAQPVLPYRDRAGRCGPGALRPGGQAVRAGGPALRRRAPARRPGPRAGGRGRAAGWWTSRCRHWTRRAPAQAIASLTQAARERGATLVATLHHVEMALAHFPRIIGLREGELAFDLPATQVTPRALARAVRAAPGRADGPGPRDRWKSPPRVRRRWSCIAAEAPQQLHERVEPAAASPSGATPPGWVAWRGRRPRWCCCGLCWCSPSSSPGCCWSPAA